MRPALGTWSLFGSSVSLSPTCSFGGGGGGGGVVAAAAAAWRWWCCWATAAAAGRYCLRRRAQALGGTGNCSALDRLPHVEKAAHSYETKITSTRSNMTKEMASYSALYWRSGLLPPSCPDSWSWASSWLHATVRPAAEHVQHSGAACQSWCLMLLRHLEARR